MKRLLLSLLILAGLAPTLVAELPFIQDNYKQALAQAKQRKQPIFGLDFGRGQKRARSICSAPDALNQPCASYFFNVCTTVPSSEIRMVGFLP